MRTRTNTRVFFLPAVCSSYTGDATPIDSPNPKAANYSTAE